MSETPAVPAVTKRAHLVTFLGALFACLVVVFWMVGPYLLALFLGGTLAMLAYPLFHRLRTWKWGPRPAAAAIAALVLILVIAPLTGFSILAVRQGIVLGRELGGIEEFSSQAITDDLSRWQLVRTLIGDPKLVNAQLKTALQSAGQFTSATVLKLGTGLPEFLLQLVLTLIAFFYFLVDGERFMEWILGLGVLDRHVQQQLVESFRDTAISAVLAGLAAAASLAALIAAGFLLLGVPGAFLAGGLTFIFAWIPLLGTAPALLAGLAYLYVQGSSTKMALLIALGVAASVVDHLVRPMVLKGRAGMHPLLGLVAIISGIQLFGILGVLLGPIMAATLVALLRIWPVVASRFGIHAAESS